MAEDKKIEQTVEQVITQFKDFVLTPARPRPYRVEEHIIIIDCDEHENTGIDTEIALLDLNNRLMSLPWRIRDDIPMQIISLLHKTHLELNINHEQLMERLTRGRVLAPLSETPENPPLFSCYICSRLLELLFQHNIINSNDPLRAVNRPVLPCPQHVNDDEPRPSTSRWSEYSHAADVHQHVNPNGPHRALDTLVPQYYHDEPMDVRTSHRRVQAYHEADSEMPPAKNAKLDEPSTSAVDLPSTSGLRSFGQTPINRTTSSDSCLESSDEEAKEARRKKFNRIKKTQLFYHRKFKK